MDLKKKTNAKEKALSEINLVNRKLVEPLKKHLADSEQLTKKLQDYEKVINICQDFEKLYICI